MSTEEQGKPEAEVLPAIDAIPEVSEASDLEVIDLPEPSTLPVDPEVPTEAPSASSADVVPSSDDEEVDQTDPFITQKNTPNPNVMLTDEVLKAFDATKREFPIDRLALLMATAEEFEFRLKKWNNAKWGSDEATQKWVRGLTEGMTHLTDKLAFLDVLKKEIGEFQQTLDAGGTKLGPALARITDHTEGSTRLSGDAANMRMQQALGLGALVQVPLWHTGIWVTIKAPSDRELLLLERALVMDKGFLAKDTGGRVFSAQGVYSIARVVDFALKHVYTATIQDPTPKKLKETILLNDLHSLILGVLMATYPSGYPLSRVCVADPTRCMHVTEEKVSLPKLLFVSKRSLNEKQLAHMRRRQQQFTDAEIKAYQAEHKCSKLPTIKINDRVSVELKVPTIAEYEASGRRWIDEVSSLTDQSIGAGLSEDERDEKVTEMALTQAARQYSHWVGQVIIDGTSQIADQNAIEENLANISGNEIYEEAFYSGVTKWITETTIALVAIPNYDCPNCGKKQQPNPELAQHPHLIALDTVQTFFTLLARRLARIRSRQLA